MKLKDRIKTYNFWVSLSSAIFLIIKVLGNQIGFKVDESLFSDLITSLCSILVILGIIVPPTKIANKDSGVIKESIIIDDNSSEKILTNNFSNLDVSQEETAQILENSLNETDTFQINSINDIVSSKPSDSNYIESIKSEENPIFIDNTTNISNEDLEQLSNETQIKKENGEPIENQLENTIFNNQSDAHDDETNLNNQSDFTKSKFQNQLKVQENLFANNIEEYIKILENELESLKNR